ncbi:MAG: hypothetical protein M9892_05815 [Bacteroidetes bacterium]|nr:hypothetical protein [Bacteroidota bacterium]
MKPLTVRELIYLPEKFKPTKENSSVRLANSMTEVTLKMLQIAIPIYERRSVYVKGFTNMVVGIKENSSNNECNGKNGIGLLINKAMVVTVDATIRQLCFQTIEKNNASNNVKFVVTDDSRIIPLLL